MSGSPILQNGKLVGAVTHVLLNDPTKGYGIFIENMLKAAWERGRAPETARVRFLPDSAAIDTVSGGGSGTYKQSLVEIPIFFTAFDIDKLGNIWYPISITGAPTPIGRKGSGTAEPFPPHKRPSPGRGKAPPKAAKKCFPHKEIGRLKICRTNFGSFLHFSVANDVRLW